MRKASSTSFPCTRNGHTKTVPGKGLDFVGIQALRAKEAGDSHIKNRYVTKYEDPKNGGCPSGFPLRIFIAHLTGKATWLCNRHSESRATKLGRSCLGSNTNRMHIRVCWRVLGGEISTDKSRRGQNGAVEYVQKQKGQNQLSSKRNPPSVSKQDTHTI